MNAECKYRPRIKTGTQRTCKSCKRVGCLIFILSCERVDAFNVTGINGTGQLSFEFDDKVAGSFRITELRIGKKWQSLVELKEFGISFLSLFGNGSGKVNVGEYKKVNVFFIVLMLSGIELNQKPDIQSKLIKVIGSLFEQFPCYVIKL